MRELKYKRFSKTLNCKILSTIPAVSAGVILTSMPTTAMFRTAVSSISRIIQSTSSNSLTKVSNSATPKFFYGSNGRRIPIQTSTPTSSKSLLKPISSTIGNSTQGTPLSSTSSNSLAKASSSTTQGFFYGSGGRKIPIQTSTSSSSKSITKPSTSGKGNTPQDNYSLSNNYVSSDSGNKSIHEKDNGVQLIITLRQRLERLEDLSNRQQSMIRKLDEMKGLVNNALNNISQIIPNK